MTRSVRIPHGAAKMLRNRLHELLLALKTPPIFAVYRRRLSRPPTCCIPCGLPSTQTCCNCSISDSIDSGRELPASNCPAGYQVRYGFCDLRESLDSPTGSDVASSFDHRVLREHTRCRRPLWRSSFQTLRGYRLRQLMHSTLATRVGMQWMVRSLGGEF